jgi:hypothetical protein
MKIHAHSAGYVLVILKTEHLKINRFIFLFSLYLSFILSLNVFFFPKSFSLIQCLSFLTGHVTHVWWCKDGLRACVGLRLQTPNARLKHQKLVSVKIRAFGKMVVNVL